MIATLLRIGWTNLRRDRVAQALTFLLPIVFFSIFATVFGGQGDDATRRASAIAVVDEDQLRGEPADRRGAAAGEGPAGAHDGGRGRRRAPRSTGAAAERLVRNGDVPVAVVLPARLRRGVRARAASGAGTPIQLLADVSDPIAPQMVLGLLQKVAMTAAPDLMMQGGLRQFEQHAGALTPQQQQPRSMRGCRAASGRRGRRRGRRGIRGHGRRRRTWSTSCAPTIRRAR